MLQCQVGKGKHMSRKSRTCIAAAAFVVVAGASIAAAPPIGRGGAENVKLSGCLIRGDGDGAGYLLTNAPAEPA